MRIVSAAACVVTATSLYAPAPVPQLTAVLRVGRAPCDAIAASGAVWIAVDGAGDNVRRFVVR